jgi:hypothetical protein
VSLLNNNSAYSVIGPYSSTNILKNCLLGLKSQSELLIVAFKNAFVCNQWAAKLQECINRRVSSGLHRTSTLGNVLDITEIEGGGNWRNFKVTFVRDTWSTEEYMLFDSSQVDLHRSVEEVLGSFEGRLDEVNRKIVEEYVTQLAEVELSNRVGETRLSSIKAFTVSARQSSVNSRVMAAYKGLDLATCETQALEHYSAHCSNAMSLVPAAFNLIYMQNAAQTLKIHRIAWQRAMVPEALPIKQKMSGRDQLTTQEQHQINKTAAHIARVKENSKNSDDVEVQSGAKDPRACGSRFFGDSCDCKVF